MSAPVITTVYLFANGMVAVFDQHGKQMPAYQGRCEDVVEGIRKAGFTGTIESVEWKASK